MNQKLKGILTNWKVLLLLVLLFSSFLTIKPQFGGNEGVIIKSVLQNSSAATGGMASPSGKLSPLAKEKIISLNGQAISTEQDYYALQAQLQPNQTAHLETTQGVYTLLTPVTNGGVDLGLKIATAPTSNLKKGLDLEGGTRVLLKPTEKISPEDFDATIENLKERLNVYGLSDVLVRGAADLSGDNFIIIEIAGVTEEEVKDLLARQGKFEAKIANQTVFFGGKNDVPYVCRSADCSGIDPRAGCVQTGEGYACRFFFGITLSPEAAERHSQITSKLGVVTENGEQYLTESIYLYLDDVEVDSLRIGADLKGRATTQIQISGSGVGRTQQEAVNNALQEMKRLQTILITGSLPVTLEVVKLDTISPSLGKEFLQNILLVGLLALLSVVAVVFVKYRKVKIVVPMVLTLVAEIVLILGFAALVGWNLDLAGIAGIIIAIGTGVDHLIIITDETMKGEATTNWTRRIKNAMFIVIGAYFTNLSGMLPLLWAGAGLLKGFALTTIAGLSFGVLVARPAFAVIIEHLLKEE